MKQHFVNQQTLKQLAYDNGLDLVPTWELDENLQTRYALIGCELPTPKGMSFGD